MTIIIPEYKTIVSYIVKIFGMYHEIQDDLEKLCINGTIYSRFKGNYKASLMAPETLTPKFFSFKNFHIPVFIHNEGDLIVDGQINFDIALNAFLLLSGIQEWIIEEKDRHGRFQYKDSLQCKFDFADLPVVNAYFEILYDQCKQNGVRVLKKNNTSNKIIITHDIDQLNSGWIEDTKYYLTKKINIPGIYKTLYQKFVLGKDSFYISCIKMLDFEKEKAIRSLYFFIPDRSGKNADYTLNSRQLQSIYAKIRGNHSLIGIHPGLETYDNSDKMKVQKLLLEKATGSKITDSRQHFLQINVAKTFDILIQNGISRDYSLGFAEHTGFRNSFALPFFPFDFKTSSPYEIIAVPLYLMDATITKYYHGNLHEHYQKVLSNMKIIFESFDNEFSVVFHNTAFRDTKYATMKDFFKKILTLF